MTNPSPSPATRVRRRGVIPAVTLLVPVIAAAVACGRSDSRPPTPGAAATAAANPNAAASAADKPGTGASAPGEPDVWLSQWHQETFAGQNPRKLWDQVSRAARAELSKPGADPSDLTARAGALGADPEKVFEFIRDQITLEPYAGVLRGARGTLAAGAGNALDRALLAQELLRLNGIESRLVAGRLSDAQTDTLLSRFYGSSQVPKVLADLIGTPSEAAAKEQAAAFATAFGIPEQAAASLAAHARTEAQAFWATVDAQSAMHLDSLDGQLRRTSLKLAVDAGRLTATLKQRFRDHYWLQVREPNGAWSAFDAAFADPRRGTAHGSHAAPLTGAPDSLYHKLAFSLVYQLKADGTPREDTVVSGTYASADALFQSIEFHIRPTELEADANTLIAMDAKTKIETLRKPTRFQGLLVSGGKVTAGRKFDLEGNTYDPSSGPSVKPVGTFVDALGGAESGVQFVGLRVVMRLTGPGRKPMIQSRTLLRGPDIASPTFAPPILEWELLLQPQWIPGDLVASRTLTQVLNMGDAVIAASEGNRPLANFSNPHSPSPLALQMSMLRETAVAHILANGTGVRAFIDEPMLTIFGHQLAGIDDKAGMIAATRTIDIVENGIRYVPISDSSAAAAFGAALRQGVADCTLEDRILTENFAGTAAKSGIAIVEQAKLEKRPVLLAKTQDIDALRSAGVTEADIEWIYDNELPDSRLVVATTIGGADAWWSIRPNGTAVLRTNGGRGQAAVESALKYEGVALKVLCGIDILKAFHQKATSGSVHGGTAAAVAFCVAGSVWGAGMKYALSSIPHAQANLVEAVLVVWDTYLSVVIAFAGE